MSPVSPEFNTVKVVIMKNAALKCVSFRRPFAELLNTIKVQLFMVYRLLILMPFFQLDFFNFHNNV